MRDDRFSGMRKFLFAFLVGLLFMILFRGSIYRSVVKYRVIEERNAVAFNREAQLSCERAMPDSTSLNDMEGAIAFAHELTANRLCYAFTSTSNDPSALLLTSNRAHCVGYAGLFSATCNLALERAGLEGSVTCKQKVAKLVVFGQDMHALFDSPFFHDHDICLVTDMRTGETIALDPTLNDILSIDRVAFVQ